MGSNNSSRGHITTIATLTLLMVFMVSLVPLEELSNGYLSNYNLLSDILVSDPDEFESAGSDVGNDIDPTLLDAMNESPAVDTTICNGNTNKTKDTSGTTTDTDVTTDTVLPFDFKAPTIEGHVVIEDYSITKNAMGGIANSLRSGNFVRIAVVGDSYIEGDIITQDLRELLQGEFGGAGVGYMNLHSEFPGFRRSVKQKSSGWKEYSSSSHGKSEMLPLSEHYFMPDNMDEARSEYKGVGKLKYLAEWPKSKFLFIAPTDTRISAKTNDEWIQYDIVGSTDVQCITIEGLTKEFSIKTSAPDVVALGVWLESYAGIGVDCMSSRGYSGITLSKINPQICHQMSEWIDYDLIILEFGINAMSAKQRNYSVYSNRMEQTINHIKKCYPKAAILLMGIGDRGEKRGGVVKSMISAPFMVNAQRNTAVKTNVMFWDTRAAMGGEDAIVEWTSAGNANKDYIHLTHKGGRKLANELFYAIKHAIGQ